MEQEGLIIELLNSFIVAKEKYGENFSFTVPTIIIRYLMNPAAATHITTQLWEENAENFFQQCILPRLTKLDKAIQNYVLAVLLERLTWHLTSKFILAMRQIAYSQIPFTHVQRLTNQ